VTPGRYRAAVKWERLEPQVTSAARSAARIGPARAMSPASAPAGRPRDWRGLDGVRATWQVFQHPASPDNSRTPSNRAGGAGSARLAAGGFPYASVEAAPHLEGQLDAERQLGLLLLDRDLVALDGRSAAAG
jgi:hypothetical protein